MVIDADMYHVKIGQGMECLKIVSSEKIIKA